MLQSMRSGIFSGFFLAILVLGGFGLVLSDGGGMFRGGVGGTDIAQIGGEPVHIAEFDRSLRIVLRQQGIGTTEAYQAGLVHQFLAQELNRKAIRMEADDIGLDLSQEEIAKTLETIMAPLVTNGMTKQEAFDRLLQMSSMSEKDFIQEVKEDTTSRLLYESVAKNAPPPSKALTNALTQIDTHTRTIAFVNLPHDKVSGITQPSDEELAKYYDSVKAGYKTAEQRDLSLLIIDPEGLKERVDVSNSQIQAFYDENIDQFTKPERRELNQAIFQDEATAQSVADKFEKNLEITVQNVTGDKKAFIGVESFEKDGLLDEIADAVFNVNNGTVVGPIKTALGWHVFQVTAILEANITPLTKVNGDIKQEIILDKMSEELYALADEMDERLVAGESIDTLVKELPIKHIELKDIRNTDGDRLSKLSPEDQQAVFKESFQLYEGENTPVEEFSDGRFFTVYVHKIVPSVVPPLTNIKDRLTTAWVANKRQTKNFVDAQSTIKTLEDGEQSIDTLSPTVKTLSSKDVAPFDLSAYGMQTLFTAGEGDVKLVTSPTGIVIGQVKSINIKNPSNDLQKKAKEQLEAQAPQELMSAYVSYLQREANAEINDRLLEQYYGQKEQ